MEVAVKQLHIETLPYDLLQEFINEAKIMHRCQHANIVRFFAICIEQGKDSLIMEFLPKGSLFQALCDSRIEINWKIRWNIALDIARGLNYLHSQNIIHCDMKSMNILLQNDWKAKITDFGMAKIKIATETLTRESSKVGSIRWKAPELFKRGAKYTKSSDVFSYGMVLWEIASRKIPYAEEQNEMIAIFIKDGEKEKIPENCPFEEIIKECWRDSPDERSDMEKIVKKLEENSKEIIEKIPGKEEYEAAIVLWVKNNYIKALPLFEKSASEGYPHSHLGLFTIASDMQNLTRKSELKEKAAIHFSLYETTAKLGRVDHVFLYATCFYYGIGTKENFLKAFEILSTLTDYPPALTLLGYMLRFGMRVQKDEKRAVQVYLKASNAGYAPAQYSLGCCYDDGSGVTRDEEEAKKWYELAAEQGLGVSYNNLGVLCANKGDYKKAFQHYEKGAKLGNSVAQFNLHRYFLNERVVPKDEEKAFYWCSMSAKQGYPDAVKEVQKFNKN